jgi:poly(3-hydroxyalkanoate) synthetase
MKQQQPTTEALAPPLFSNAWEYVDDAWQRSILFMDVLRKRGDIYHEHMAEGNPPVLTFDYKIVMDGRTFETPVNFALVKIIDRRKQRGFKKGDDEERRAVQVEEITRTTKSIRRPIVIIDPRAGHGPGIGGSKRDSEIGVALVLGHPVYFILFFPNPEPGQTLTDVQRSQVKFIEEIGRLHPDAGKPALIGNCQGGWASALIGADQPGITGPLVFNGSPLSYWAGVDGKNPMRYKGGLTGGTWMASLWSDLGGGKFDGANLVSGFEDLNPSNTFWSKQYNVYSKVDTEEKRYLEFERWWNGYYYMTAEEIRFIVANLFVGNRLEQGLLELDENTRIDLKNIDDPILVFASSGDNITPPQQALNWIVRVWESVEGLKNQGQVVVYLVHKTIGHLGIFVSTKVSKKEHTEIIGSIDLMEYLNPGLYEMVIDEGEDFQETGDYKVKFEERTMDDILALDDGSLDEEDFRAVSAVSDFNDEFYQTFLSPWVKWLTTEHSAEWLRQANPLRWSRYAFSDKNPLMTPFKAWAPVVKENRRQVSQDNLFLSLEKSNAKAWAGLLDCFRDLRDDTQEFCFKTIYSNPLVRNSFEERINEISAKEDKLKKEMEMQGKKKKLQEQKKMRADMEKGGFVDGLFRLMAALIGVDHTIEQEELKYIRKLVTIHNIMTNTNEADLKQRMLDQVKLLQFDEKLAIAAIPKLVRGAENRLTAIQMLEALNETDTIDTSDATKLLNKIRAMLDDKKTLE